MQLGEQDFVYFFSFFSQLQNLQAIESAFCFKGLVFNDQYP